MKLIRDVLDKQVLDREHHKIGRIDGLAIELRKGKPPRIAYLEIGGIALSARLGNLPRRWVVRIWSSVGGRGRYRHPYRIPWSKVTSVDKEVRCDVSFRETPFFAWQRWLLRHVVGRLPGGAS